MKPGTEVEYGQKEEFLFGANPGHFQNCQTGHKPLADDDFFYYRKTQISGKH